MTANLQLISDWCNRGRQKAATHLIVARDSFSNENYPVFVAKSQNVREIQIKIEGRPMQVVDEVYWLEGDISGQLKLTRSFTYGPHF